MNQTIEKYISDEAGDFYSSGRWSNPDTPGSAHIVSIDDRVKYPDWLAAFRKTDPGKYLLSLIESYEEALNDDWMPFEIIGLPLDKAREFIHTVWDELQQVSADDAVKKLRDRYAYLSNS